MCRNSLDKLMMQKKTISFVSCQERETTVGESEIVLTKYSTIQPSSRKFESSALVTQSDMPVIHMEDLCSLTSHTSQKVTVSVKVKSINPPEIVNNRHGKQLKKQDCIVADSTACGRVVLWENDIDRLKENQSYKLADIGVRSFQGVNFLSVVDGCVISEADDIGETADIEGGDPEQATVK